MINIGTNNTAINTHACQYCHVPAGKNSNSPTNAIPNNNLHSPLIINPLVFIFTTTLSKLGYKDTIFFTFSQILLQKTAFVCISQKIVVPLQRNGTIIVQTKVTTIILTILNIETYEKVYLRCMRLGV
jgi:hypothetical protein